MIDVNKLQIEHVTQAYFAKNSIDIKFQLPSGTYELHVSQNKNGIYFPTEIYHITDKHQCPFCDANEVGCKGLTNYKKELFYRLIEFPSIRLEWLYLPHAVQA